MDKQTDIQTGEQIHLLLWAGGTIFPVVLLCQFFGFWQEIGFGDTYLRI
jgi:hypothetical protein